MQQLRRDVLNGWKEIAAYLGRDPRTVERWEKQRSLPVRRLPGNGRATVYALIPELDAWLASAPRRGLDDGGTADEVMSSEADLSQAPATAPPVNLLEENALPSSPIATPGHSYRKTWAAAAVSFAMLAGFVLFLSGRLHSRRRADGAAISVAAPRRVQRALAPSPVFGVEELYLRGCYQTELRTPTSLRRAQDAFTSAIQRDAHYAPAYAGLASTYLLLREYSMLPDTEAYPRAQAAAQQALLLDPDLPQAHAAMGFVDFFWAWDTRSANHEFEEAVRLDPALALSHHWFGSVLVHQGRFRQGLRELNTAQRLEPSSAPILSTRALAMGLTGDRDRAFELLEEALSMERPGQAHNPATMHLVLGVLSLMPPRNTPRYLSEAMIAAQLREDAVLVGSLRHASAIYQHGGEQAMWRALLEQERGRHSTGGPTYAMARYEAELGSREQTLNDLTQLYARHDPALIGISVDPLFTSLHTDKRFQELRNDMGLPPIDR